MRYFPVFLTLLCVALSAYGQGDPEQRKQLAKELIIFENYAEALTVLYNDRELRLRDKETRFLMAVCQFQINQLDEAEAILTSQIENEKDPFPECWLYLGKIFHARHQFAEAARYYKLFLQRIPEQHPSRTMIADEIRRCSNGIRLQYWESRVFVENLGPSVNTSADEFGAVPSPNFQTRLYFSTRRPGNIGGRRTAQGSLDERFGTFSCDIFTAVNEGGVWGSTKPLHYLLNSPRHEILLDFNGDGSVMYFYQGSDWYNGSIIVDTFQQAEVRRLRSDPFLGPADAIVDQAAPQFVNARTVIFPSRKPGGFGGLDLYISSLADGRWSNPENLGPAINSPYDETTPFLAADGRTLFFSSNRPDRSIGGFDVFKSVYLSDYKMWMRPENMGLPVNSAGDDTHFRLAPDGFSAFFTSSRKDGMGMRDIYLAYFSDFLTEQEPPETPGQTFFPQFPEPAPPYASGSENKPRHDAPRGTPLMLRPLFFNLQSDIFSPQNREILDLVDRLLQDSDASLLILAHGRSGPSASQSLFSAANAAAPVVDYFLSKGIGPERLSVRGQLDELPADTQPFQFAVDFFLSSMPDAADGVEVRHLVSQTGLPEGSLAYRVKIAMLNGPFPGHLMDGLPFPVVERYASNPSYHYFAGVFPTYAEAAQWRQTHLSHLGLQNAPVTPYVGEWPLSEETLPRYLDSYPDLHNYLSGRSR